MVSVGLALGSTEEIPPARHLQEKGIRAVSPLTVQMHMPNAAAAAVGLEHKAKAGIISPVIADASGAAAIGQAWRHIVLGEADVAICGGIDTWIGPVTIAAFSQMDMLSTRNDDRGRLPSVRRRPRRHRVQRGRAMPMVESEEHAVARGAPILASERHRGDLGRLRPGAAGPQR